MRAPRRARREVEEALELAPGSPATFALELLAVEQVALGRAARRVADHPRPAADERDRPAAVPLEVEQAEDRDEVADVERRPGRIEPVVGRDRPAGRQARRRARASSRGACPRQPSSSSRPREPGEVGRAASVVGAVTATPDARPSARSARASRTGVHHRPLCYRADRHANQPRAAPAPSAERRRRRAAAAAAPSEGRHRHPALPVRGPSSWLGLVGFVAAVGRLRLLQRGPAGPEGRRSTTSTSTSRRWSTTGPARSSWPGSASSSARSSTYDQIPPG